MAVFQLSAAREVRLPVPRRYCTSEDFSWCISDYTGHSLLSYIEWSRLRHASPVSCASTYPCRAKIQSEIPHRALSSCLHPFWQNLHFSLAICGFSLYVSLSGLFALDSCLTDCYSHRLEVQLRVVHSDAFALHRRNRISAPASLVFTEQVLNNRQSAKNKFQGEKVQLAARSSYLKSQSLQVDCDPFVSQYKICCCLH